jgi:predicted nucleotidyltransferase
MRATVVSLPALALLKVVAWQDRHYVAPLKDAHDLALILKHYLGAGNEPRLWEEFAAWTEDADFDYELASARMCGHDVAAMLDEAGVRRICDVLARQTDPESPAQLPADLDRRDPERARMLLTATLRGMLERN